jgi:hypothetical protein
LVRIVVSPSPLYILSSSGLTLIYWLDLGGVMAMPLVNLSHRMDQSVGVYG